MTEKLRVINSAVCIEPMLIPAYGDVGDITLDGNVVKVEVVDIAKSIEEQGLTTAEKDRLYSALCKSRVLDRME